MKALQARKAEAVTAREDKAKKISAGEILIERARARLHEVRDALALDVHKWAHPRGGCS